ncbi:MAG: DMT family transporter [Nostocaceae cyanobacterium]|nr:DMT family transporter [Nostocaceae cyanobacterium]
MTEIRTKASNLISRTPGKIYLWLAILIFGAANAVTRQLTELGEQNLINGRNPISFCNLLFVGNICALLMLLLVYYRQLNIPNLKQISGQNWLNMGAAAILSGAIAPALIFMALDLTMVTNVVLIGRIEPPLALALSIFLLKERVDIWSIVGAIISLAGVVITVFLQTLWENMMSPEVFITVGQGEIMTAIAAISLAVSTIISKARLQQIPLGIFSVFRLILATIVLFCVVISFYGVNHFMDVASPFLWQWMLIYGGVIIVLGQLCWFNGLKTSSASEVSLASSFAPIAGIVFAYLILGEAPTAAQYIGGSIILLGIFLSQIGARYQNSRNTHTTRETAQEEMSNEVGFKGI